MEKIKWKNSIPLLCVKADRFPEGIKNAFDQLEAVIPRRRDQTLYGISYGTENGQIIYYAAAVENYPGEAESLGLKKFILRSGFYLSVGISNWRSSEARIPLLFSEMLNHPEIDPDGYCLEVYPNLDDLQCLVKLKD